MMASQAAFAAAPWTEGFVEIGLRYAQIRVCRSEERWDLKVGFNLNNYV
jgi:hypothetical protein